MGLKTGRWFRRALFEAGLVQGCSTVMVVRTKYSTPCHRDGDRLPTFGGRDAYRRRLWEDVMNDVTRKTWRGG
jgi:hypothetical protein